MHTRPLRLALLTSLGLLPLGCDRDAGGDGALSPSASTDLHSSALDDAGVAECGVSTVISIESRWVAGQLEALTAPIDTGLERCENGVLHRVTPVTCSSGLPRPLPPAADAGSTADGGGISQVDYLYGPPHSQPASSCTSDADCTARPLGYCARTSSATPAYSVDMCHYGCLQDEDCGSGFLCECGVPVGQCVSAGCRSDADCGGDSLCAAWYGESVCGTAERRYSCQSPEDECNMAADCPSDYFCSGEGGVRHCQPPSGIVCGRPFLVEGVERQAPLRSGTGWAGGASRERASSSLTAEQRSRAAEHWAAAALMEHASIAAFARFTLQLMHLGAPRDLIVSSQHAMLDETAHAEACFALASRYLEAPVEPGRLAMEAALDEHELEPIVRLAFREGCVGETAAALEEREDLDHASDPEVRAALERIAVDELRHAELAWRFVRWALGQSGAVRPLLEREAARLEAELSAPPSAAADGELVEHGVLSARRLQHLRRAALGEVVLPCARRLLASPGAEASATA